MFYFPPLIILALLSEQVLDHNETSVLTQWTA